MKNYLLNSIYILFVSIFFSCNEEETPYIGKGLIINEFLASNDAAPMLMNKVILMIG